MIMARYSIITVAIRVPIYRYPCTIVSLKLQVGANFDCPIEDMEEMMDCLREEDPQDLIRSVNVSCTVSDIVLKPIQQLSHF